MIVLRDNSTKTLSEQELEKLKVLDRISLSETPHLFLYGREKQNFNSEEAYLWSIHKDTVTTNNLMGFLSIEGTPVKIASRFARNQHDYFLHYMLQKALLGNIISSEISSGHEEIYAFWYYLFPSYLAKALSQGIYKEYRHQNYNNANVKGRIDISRHIQKNRPFAYKIAYDVREYSLNNRITQLIRATIDFISKHNTGRTILNGTPSIRQNVEIIKEYVPNPPQISKIIDAGQRQISNPYWKEYEQLRQLCLKILRKETLSMASSSHLVHGILFDGAILWEEYLNTVFQPIGFTHPNNRARKDALPIFEHGGNIRYPDFYYKKEGEFKIIADAKYKNMSNNSIDREISHQIITYLYITRAKDGVLVYPGNDGISSKNLVGYGGKIHWLPMFVDHSADSFQQYCLKMHEQEEHIKAYAELIK